MFVLTSASKLRQAIIPLRVPGTDDAVTSLQSQCTEIACKVVLKTKSCPLSSCDRCKIFMSTSEHTCFKLFGKTKVYKSQRIPRVVTVPLKHNVPWRHVQMTPLCHVQVEQRLQQTLFSNLCVISYIHIRLCDCRSKMTYVQKLCCHYKHLLLFINRTVAVEG